MFIAYILRESFGRLLCPHICSTKFSYHALEIIIPILVCWLSRAIFTSLVLFHPFPFFFFGLSPFMRHEFSWISTLSAILNVYMEFIECLHMCLVTTHLSNRQTVHCYVEACLRSDVCITCLFVGRHDSDMRVWQYQRHMPQSLSCCQVVCLNNTTLLVSLAQVKCTHSVSRTRYSLPPTCSTSPMSHIL